MSFNWARNWRGGGNRVSHALNEPPDLKQRGAGNARGGTLGGKGQQK